MSGPKPTLPGERRAPEKERAGYRTRNQKIRERYALGGPNNTCKALGERFGLTAARVHQIVKGRRR